MAEPRTLLQMAGAPTHPAPLAEAALVIVDAQGEYREGKLPLEGIGPAMERLASLLAAAREAGTPVIHVAHKGRPGSLFDREGPGGAILPEVAPRLGEPVVEKGLPNAFAGTDLQARLQAAGRRELILAGFQTHMCISATARAGLDLGWRVTVAGDACATRALPDPMGGAAIPARRSTASPWPSWRTASPWSRRSPPSPAETKKAPGLPGAPSMCSGAKPQAFWPDFSPPCCSRLSTTSQSTSLFRKLSR